MSTAEYDVPGRATDSRIEPRQARVRMHVSGPLRVGEWQERLPEGIRLDVCGSGAGAHHEIDLRAEASRFDVESLRLAFRDAVAAVTPTRPTHEAYCRWRQSVLLDPEFADERARWHERESLLTDGQRPSGARLDGGAYRAERVERIVPPSSCAAVRDMTAARGWEAPTLWLTGLAVVLVRLTGERELLLGLGLDGRNYEQLTDALGPYAQVVPFRVSAPDAWRVEAVCDRISDAYRSSWQTQELYSPADGTNRQAWRFGFEYRRWPAAERVDGVEYSVCRASTSGAPEPDVRLLVEETAAETRVEIEYDAHRHDAPAMSRLVERCVRAVQEAVRHPEQLIADLEHLGPSDEQRWREINGSRARGPSSPLSAHAWIEQVAALRQHAISVGVHGRVLTYEQLNARANRLARHLRASGGVGREACVGLCLPRGPELMTAILAVWKAGAAYVPLDDEWPARRMAALLAHTRAKIVVTDATGAHRFAGRGVSVVDLDRDAEPIAAHDAENLGLDVPPEQLAYVLFTSGSTGEPKGVAVEHRQLVHYTRALLDRLGPQPSWTFASLSTVAADLGNTALLGALCAGARLEWLDRQTASDAAALDAYCLACPLDAAKMTPSHVRALLSGVTERPAWLPRRALVIGGEALGADLVAQLRRLAPELRVVNHYGPTETTIGVLAGDVTGAVSLGRPLGEAQAWIRHAGGSAAAAGETGTLWIGGPSVSRGYWDDAAQTAERFRPDPHGREPGARLYCTGDLAVLRPDGGIEYRARSDEQVKIRGFRVEPEEVAAAVRGLRGIRQAAVLAHRDSDGEARLVAYVVPEGESREQEWRATLEDALPSYLAPAQWIRVERLPLLTNGKLDRAALPAPVWSESAPDVLTPTEEIVAGIWSQVLKRPVVGRDDHFFRLGGHSLLGTRTVARLRAAFNVALPLRKLFDRPTVRGLAATIDELSHADATPSTLPLVHSADTDAPLSFAQQRLWFLEQLEPGRAVYNVPLAVRAAGLLDRGALERALTDITGRHDSLRTVFSENAPGELRQHVLAPAPVLLPVEDLTPLAPGEREAEARRRAEAEARRPFDLTNGPLWRGTLLRLGPDDHIVLLTLHHIICDGWSMAILVRELGRLYRAHLERQPALLTPPAIQYADYARWQRQWLRGDVFEAQLRYWRGQLAELPAPLTLPADRPRPPLQSFRGGHLTRTWDATVADGVRTLSQQEGVTPFMTLLAAFQALLARYTGEPDICVGTPIANRSRVEVEEIIGFFVNTLVLRTDLSGDPSFVELLRRVRRSALGAYAHQDLPFEQLVDALQPERALSRNPLFQVMFVFQNGREQPLQLPGLRLSSLAGTSTASKFDVTLTVTPQDESLGVGLEYSADLFEAATAGRMLDHLEVLLRGAVAAPHARLSQLPLLTAAETARLHAVARGPAREADAAVPAHHRISRHARETPDRAAVVCGGVSVSFAALDARANRLAHGLLHRRIGAGDRVLVCMERSVEMVVALLATLKIGAAYVPIDAAFPRDRVRFIAGDAEALLALTDASTSERFAGIDVPSWNVEHASSVTADLAAGDPAVLLDSRQLAYIIYTSGSTGQPKGVMVTHEGLSNYLTWSASAYDMPEGAVAPVHSPLTFDLTVTSLLTPLAAGRAVVLLPDEPDLRSLQGLRGMGLVKITPAHLHFLAGMMTPDTIVNWAQTLVVGGEALTGPVVRTFRAHAPVVRVINEYGPTETTVGCCVYELPVATDIPADIPIGRPIAGTVVRVLDSSLNLVPVGVPGELHVGGVGLARGYVGRPELTAERFVPDPFSETPGARLYRTGDIVRLQPDGDLLYLGRRDDQVKIRGHRVELGEIEAVLREHPGVARCAVRPRGSGADAPLCAFVVPAAPDGIDATEIRQFLQARLPAYMLPAHTLIVERLPLTSNGKIDTHALLAQPLTVGEPDPGERPFTSTESRLAPLWRRTLGMAPTPRSDFFASGGHSLMASALVTHVRHEFAIDLAVRSIFEAPVFAGFAARIDEALQAVPLPIAFDDDIAAAAARNRAGPRDSIVLLCDGPDPPLYLVHPISGSITCYRVLGTEHPPRRVHGVQCPSLFDDHEPVETIDEMALRYIADLSAAYPDGPCHVGGWSSGGLIAYEMGRRMAEAGRDVRSIILIDTLAPAPQPPDGDDALLAHLSGGLWQSGQAGSLDEKLAALLDILRARGVAPARFSLEWLRRVYMVYRANHRAKLAYTPRPYHGAVHIVRASQSIAGTPFDAGWGPLVTGSLRTHLTPGAHHTLFSGESIPPLLDLLWRLVRDSEGLI